MAESAPTAARSLRKWTWIIAAPWAILLVVSVSIAITDFQIAERQQSAVAVVIAHHPEDHDQYDLRLSVGGSSYIGRDRPVSGDLIVNEHVPVFFDPRDPKRMSLTSFADRGQTELGPVPVLVLGIFAVLGYTAYQWKTRPRPVRP
jgi:hypothetical protein